jgi:hypothetical protein
MGFSIPLDDLQQGRQVVVGGPVSHLENSSFGKSFHAHAALPEEPVHAGFALFYPSIGPAGITQSLWPVK